VTDEITVLDHGFVRLDDCMADDLAVVNAARVSFARRVSELGDADRGLVRFLMRERHSTPFEHAVFRFHIKCPIFVAREWMRHRAGSYNEHSARYSELPDEFYVPAAEDVRTQVGKPGSYSFEPVGEEAAQQTRETLTATYRDAYLVYRGMIDRGIAREIARMALPVGIYTQFHWTLNARSLMNFLSLRNADTAQLEIRRFAEAVEVMFGERMPVTHASFVEFGRRAP
jgi:thymidylate synthase (FAD)